MQVASGARADVDTCPQARGKTRGEARPLSRTHRAPGLTRWTHTPCLGAACWGWGQAPTVHPQLTSFCEAETAVHSQAPYPAGAVTLADGTALPTPPGVLGVNAPTAHCPIGRELAPACPRSSC